MRFNPDRPGKTVGPSSTPPPRQPLEKIFREYGEEPRARRLARLVVEARRRHPFRTHSNW